MTGTPGRPNGDEEDIDARFAAIVASLDWDPTAEVEDDPGLIDEGDPRSDRDGYDTRGSDDDTGDGRNDSTTNDGDKDDGRNEGDEHDPALAAVHGAPTASAPLPDVDPEADPHADEVNLPPSGWRDYEVDEEEEHFVPPPVPPLPAGDLHFWAILIGLTVGPLVLIFTHVFPLLPGQFWTWLGLIFSIGGFVLLVLRSPTDRDPDDSSGGARV